MRKWLAFIAGLSVIVVSGAALGLTDSETPSGNDEIEKVVVEEDHQAVLAKEARWPDETYVIDEPKPVEEPAEAPKDLEPEADTTPPALQILHPIEGQVFESKKVVFEGTTEPGASVYAGEYEADVDEKGNWRIVLFLSPGANHATIRAKDAAGNVAEASVTIVFEPGEEPKDEDKPKEEDKPREEDKPKEEVDEGAWEFVAHQAFGECAETPPFDVFYGKGKPGSVIHVLSEYGSGEAVVNDHGEWELKVYFEGAPVGQGILVKVIDQFDHKQMFEFTRTG